MSITIDKLEELYAKVKEGRASIAEYVKYTIALKTQCMKEDALLDKLERSYKEKSHN